MEGQGEGRLSFVFPVEHYLGIPIKWTLKEVLTLKVLTVKIVAKKCFNMSISNNKIKNIQLSCKVIYFLRAGKLNNKLAVASFHNLLHLRSENPFKAPAIMLLELWRFLQCLNLENPPKLSQLNWERCVLNEDKHWAAIILGSHSVA